MNLSKLLRFIFSFICTLALIIALNTQMGKTPPIGKLFDPFHGFWQNAEQAKPFIPQESKLPSLLSTVKVSFDERLVPHIFAQNEHDLYLVQGYLTAKYRLWQMELQTYAAAGRLSEIIGKQTLAYDRKQRKLGMLWAAERAWDFAKNDSISKLSVEAYTAGVNAYINELDYASYPLEYKLMGYVPETWTPLKTVLLSKYMAAMLTDRELDVEMNNALRLFGKEKMDELYPDYSVGQDPVIHVETEWNFVPAPAVAPTDSSHYAPLHSEAPIKADPEGYNGSNNWAVAGNKTASRKAILCGDPHLPLNLPSIWYELQLTTPDMNVYGVSIPGAPGVIIGFNEHIAWSLTNATRDVKDWYTIQFSDETRQQYLHENEWRNTTQRVETIEVRNGETVHDTIIYTHFGPISFTDPKNPRANLALKWLLHEPSNDFLTFYYFSKAKNYDDFLAAAKHYVCPGQNFVYADVAGNIAMWQHGRYPNYWPEQGKFILDGSRADHDWQGYIPFEHNPQSYNPPRGFVSSTNQHPTAESYPYYYQGRFEHYRNRRLNKQLAILDEIELEDMQALQNDSYNLQAAEALPTLLGYLDKKVTEGPALAAFQELQNWDYHNRANSTAASIYQLFWRTLFKLIWDEIYEATLPLSPPHSYTTTQLLISEPDHDFMDRQSTPNIKEQAEDLVFLAFQTTVDSLEKWKKDNNRTWTWGTYRGTDIGHMAKIPALSALHLPTHGHSDALNATTKTAGPSWRMVVEMSQPVKAYGIYPGGQSGNPGSVFYANMMDKWVQGKYDRLHFLTTSMTDKDLNGNPLQIMQVEPLAK